MFGDMIRRNPPVHIYGTPVAVERTAIEIPNPPPIFFETPSSPESLLPAIDGPPSSEGIRAYTEAMKRSSTFGNNSRTGTLSSVSSEHATLSRQSSVRSSTSNMGSARSNRPESIQIFSSMFSRSRRKLKRESSIGSGKRSTSSVNLTESVVEEESAKDHYFSKKNTRTRKNISAPKNFQHITHTRQDHLPNLHRKSRMELASEFSAMRASQVPTHGELKGIRATDLHFENFSSEALSTATGEPLRQVPRSPRQQFIAKKLASPLWAIGKTKSHDNLKAAPPRPPRSPLPQACTLVLPARTSSRTASVLFDQFDPCATMTSEWPYASASFRKPSPFHLPTPSNPPAGKEQHEATEQIISYAITTPGDEAWPLATSLSGSSGQSLTDVQEEDEEFASRSSRLSLELRTSQSVPALRRRTPEKATLAWIPTNETTVPIQGPIVHDFQLPGDSWESDIDWCYENEVEADCEYEWDQCSDENSSIKTATMPSNVQPVLQLKVQDDEWVYRGRFRPSSLVPALRDFQQSSPVSNVSTPSSDPRTPAFLQPKHIRSSSRASSFKESHGFNLSPTLLIPADFQSQMEQDDIYQEQFIQDSAPAFNHESFTLPFSPIDANQSSTASYRSSNFSHASAHSSSSTRISCATSRGSQDSIVLSQAAMLSKSHRSIGSDSSLPDLVYSTHQQAYGTDLPLDMAALSVEEENSDLAPAPGVAGPASSLASLQQRRMESVALEQRIRTFASVPDAALLTPVLEMFPAIPFEAPLRRTVHGRKFSAPISPSVKECKGRARSSTISGGKMRASYALFPQI